MKILEKQISATGKRAHIMLFGIKIASYNIKNNTNVHGIGNIVQIPKNSNITVHIYGDNNKVVVEDGIYHPAFAIYIGVAGELNTNNCTVHIGKNLSAGSGFVRICEDGTIFEIGDDCMFSENISIWASDTHTILHDGKCSNVGKYIKLGNHVWLGYGVTVLKNTRIADNCIVGTQSVVAGQFNTSGSVIAGNPARVVKTGVNWNRLRPNQFLQGENL